MPTYAYRCTVCSHEFDTMQKFSDSPIEECPACGEFTRRVIHPAGIIFKGDGWYINDSRGKPKESSGSDSKAETKKDGADTSAKPVAEKSEPAAASPAAAPVATAD